MRQSRSEARHGQYFNWIEGHLQETFWNQPHKSCR
jgi:hypothetical protein